MNGIWLAIACAPQLAGLLGLAVRHHRRLSALWREPTLAVPVLIVESDDWGPGEVADADALRRLAELLEARRDARGAVAVMTLGVVAAAPDGAAILAGGCRRYRRCTLAEPRFAAIVDAIRHGIRGGVFALQRHGTEHCWPAALMARLHVDPSLRDWLGGPTGHTEALPDELQSRWVDGGSLPSRELDEAEVAAAVADEVALLQQTFGERPRVAVPNTFVWSAAVERAWMASGVVFVVTPGRRFGGRDAGGGLIVAERGLLNGGQGATGARYVVRDDYFEPLRGHAAGFALAAVAGKWAQRRPCLLESHRDNYNRGQPSEAAFAELERLLDAALARLPELRFVSTETLAGQIAAGRGELISTRTSIRVEGWLARLLVEPEFARLLKYSGLRWLVAGAHSALRSVNSGRFRCGAN